MAAVAGGGAQHATTFLPPLAAAPAQAAATLLPTPAAAPRLQQALPPAHLQQLQQQQMLQHQQQLQLLQQQHALASASVTLPYGPSLVPLPAGAAYQLGGSGIPMPMLNLAAHLANGAAGAAAGGQHQPTLVYGLAPPPAVVGAGSGADDTLYVNPRQLAGILRRRSQREKQEARHRQQQRLKPKKGAISKRTQSSVQRQLAKDRPRGPNGKFLSKKELEALEAREGELADRADARQLPQGATAAEREGS